MDSLINDSVSLWQQSWSWEMGWHIVGWTMLYFLAAGTVLLAMLWFVRLLLSGAAPRVRYTTTLAGFAVLALLPIGIAGWLTTDMASPLRERGELTAPELTAPELTTPELFIKGSNYTKKLFNAEVAKSAEDAEKTLFAAGVMENRVPDQATSIPHADSVSIESALNGSVEYLPWVWVIGTPLTFLLLATGLVGADRLRRSCRVLTDGPIHEACEQLRIALGIGREVGIAICDRVGTPLLVGVVRPLILLPPAALLGWPPEQLEMVLLHELAHVRRWDNAVNLAQRIAESVLFFHPAVWIVSNWVRRDREDCCDAVVVAHTAKPQAYAELLLALASRQPLAGLAASAMARHPLASRIRRILKLEDEPMLVSRKGLMLGTSAVMAVALCVAFLAPSEAEEPQASRKRQRPEVSRESERVADERSSEETTKDSNDTKNDLTAEDTEDDWPDETAVFPSPIEGELSRQAWKLLRLKMLPVTDSEQKTAKENSLRVGVKIVDGPFRLGRPYPFLLMAVNKETVSSYKDLAKALNKIQKERPDSCVIKFTDAKVRVFFDVVVDVVGTTGNIPSVVRNQTTAKGKDLTTEDAESTEQNKKTSKELKPTYRIVYPLGENEGQAKELLEAVGGLRESAVITKDGKKMVVVGADEAGHKKFRELFDRTRGKNSGAMFPTLEEQKAADFAYILLGVELDKLKPEDLERVKAKGYAGGLRVTTEDSPMHGLRNEDLLVGLHIWPTESLEKVQEILTRSDIHDLTPLKFYVLRLPKPEPTQDVEDVMVEIKEDRVITGRIAVNLTAWAEKEGFKQARLKQSLPTTFVHPGPAQPASQSRYISEDGEESSLLYDGKTFEQWRNLWKTELKTEKRIECINALAAFGRAGKGPEAAEAILEVAGEYDFSMNGNRIETNAVGKLKESILEALTNYGNHLPERDWLPLLQEHIESDPAKYRGFTAQLLPRLLTSDPGVKPILSKLQTSEDQVVRQAALAAISYSQEIYTDEEKNELIQNVLESEPVTAIRVLDQRLLNYVSIEQAVEFLLSEDNDVQLAARRAFRMFSDKEKGARLTNQLLAKLSGSTRQRDQLATIRALNALHYQAKAAEPVLTTIIETTDNEELMIAAVSAREMVTLENGDSRMSISPESKNAISVSKRWLNYLADELKLKKALYDESVQVTGEQGIMGGGGMGGGGGGMF